MQNLQNKPTKLNLPNQTYQTKSNLAYQAYLTKPTKSKLLVKAVNAWVRSAFGNVLMITLFDCKISALLEETHLDKSIDSQVYHLFRKNQQ